MQHVIIIIYVTAIIRLALRVTLRDLAKTSMGYDPRGAG